MQDLIKVALLYGGRSQEHEISQISAASILQNLDPNLYEIFPIGISKDGVFYLNEYKDLLSSAQELPIKTLKSVQLNTLFENNKFILDVNVVFPVLHGPLYEDGALQGLLTLSNIAFVGSKVLASAIGMDKDIARRLVKNLGILTAKYKIFNTQIVKKNYELICEESMKDLAFPIFVKPCHLGSSVGINKAYNKEELILHIQDAAKYDDEIILEENIKGLEIEVAVLENLEFDKKPRVSLPGEIKILEAGGFYSYKSKYLDESLHKLCIPAELPEEIINKLQKYSEAIFLYLKCEGLARIDFFVNLEKNLIYFSEINTMPGFTCYSMYPKLWEVSGISYKKLLNDLIMLAIKNFNLKKLLITDYQ